jgi:hypothetical protein
MLLRNVGRRHGIISQKIVLFNTLIVYTNIRKLQ